MLLVVLAGCSSSPSLQELEDEAIVTGDWTAVEERERLIERKRKKNVLDCPAGYTSACYEVGLSTECACVRAVAGSRVFPR